MRTEIGRSRDATPTAFRQHAGIKSFAANPSQINSRVRLPASKSYVGGHYITRCLR
jgi:hypothetical protein